jgi:peptidoglycan/LPS O-acetylase OafA/YrhL
VYLGSRSDLALFDLPILGKVLEWFGARCYSVYLLHYPIIAYTDRLFMRAENLGYFSSPTHLLFLKVSFAFAQLLTIIFVSETMYRIVEKPWNLKGREAAKSPLAQLQPEPFHSVS